MEPEHVLRRYLASSAPVLSLPGRNRAVEYNHLPANLATLLEKNARVFVKDPAHFVDPDRLSKDLAGVLSTRIYLEARAARRRGQDTWATALEKAAFEADKKLDITVQPVTSPSSGITGWVVFATPEVKSFWQAAELEHAKADAGL